LNERAGKGRTEKEKEHILSGREKRKRVTPQ